MLNRNQLIEHLIGNLANAILHKILEKAIETQEITEKYDKEIKNSYEIAKVYREKINPKDTFLPEKDIEEIKRKIIQKVKAELLIRISKGYKNIDLSLVDSVIEDYLRELRIA